MKITIELDGSEKAAEIRHAGNFLITLANDKQLEIDTPKAHKLSVAIAPADLPDAGKAIVKSLDTYGPSVDVPARPIIDTAAAFGGSVPIAPPALPAAPPAAAPRGQVDSEGFPHDSRIHSTPPATNKDGTWRTRRNLDKAEKTRVEAELRNLMQTPAPVGVTMGIAPPGPPPAPTTLPTPPVSMQVPPPLPPGGIPPLPPGIASIAPPPPPPAPNPFVMLMQEIGPHVHSDANPQGRLTPDYLGQLAAHIGCVDGEGKGSVRLLQQAPHLIPAFRDLVMAGLR